jgi:hypothetical protein
MATFHDQLAKIRQQREALAAAQKATHIERMELAKESKRPNPISVGKTFNPRETILKETEVSLNQSIKDLLVKNHKTLSIQ